MRAYREIDALFGKREEKTGSLRQKAHRASGDYLLHVGKNTRIQQSVGSVVHGVLADEKEREEKSAGKYR